MTSRTGQWVRSRLSSSRLYLCTPNRPDLADFAEAALAGGVDVIQLRQKGIEARQELEALQILAAACARHDALLAVNDRADVALAANADVLHLGQDDLPVTWARRILGEEIVIGRSTHDQQQARAAANEPGVDYFCAGPCWPTPTKPDRPAPGLDLVRYIRGLNPERPWFAIGGIDRERIPSLRAAGADRIVVVRAITNAVDPRSAATELHSAIMDAPDAT